MRDPVESPCRCRNGGHAGFNVFSVTGTDMQHVIRQLEINRRVCRFFMKMHRALDTPETLYYILCELKNSEQPVVVTAQMRYAER